MILKYNEEGILYYWEFLNNEFLNTNNIDELFKKVYKITHEGDLLNLSKELSYQIKELTPANFETFWSKYNYKMGKVEAEKAFKKLKDSDKKLAIVAIKKYDSDVNNSFPKVAKLYPATYLNKKRFLDYF